MDRAKHKKQKKASTTVFLFAYILQRRPLMLILSVFVPLRPVMPSYPSPQKCEILPPDEMVDFIMSSHKLGGCKI